MPQTKSAKKALKKALRNRRFNLYYLEKIRSLRRKLRKAAQKKQKKENEKLLQLFYKYVDKAVKEKVFHKNKGARLKARLTRWLNASFVSAAKKQKTTKKRNSK